MRTGVVELIAPARLGTSFRWLFGSQLASNLGDGVLLAAGPLLIATVTREPAAVAGAALAQRLPWLFFALGAGVVADQVDRRKLILVGNSLRVAIVAALVALVLADQYGVAAIYVVVFLLGTCEVFVDTTASTLMPMIVEPADLGIANARRAFVGRALNELAGPALGAALFAVGVAVPFVLLGALIAASVVLIARIELQPVAQPSERPPVREAIGDGMRFLWGHRAVRALALTILLFNFTFGATWSMLVLYAIEILEIGESGFGILLAASAAGGMIGSTLYGGLERRFSLANLMRAGLVLETLFHLGFALTDTAWVALVIMFVFGVHTAVWGTTSTTIRQRAVPTELQGRVASVYMLCVFGGIAVGNVLAGLIASAGGVRAVFWFGFVGSALLVVALWREFSFIAHADD